MLAALNIIAAGLKLFPAILDAVIAIDEKLQVAGIGSAKLELVIGAVKSIYDAEQSIQKAVDWKVLSTAVGNTASTIVSVLKKVGVLKSSGQAPELAKPAPVAG